MKPGRRSRRIGGLLVAAVLLAACRDGLTGPESTLELRGERQHSAVIYNEAGYSELRCGFVDVSARLSGRSKDFASWEGATLRLWARGSGALLGEVEFSAEEISEWFGLARIGTDEAQEMAWLVWAGEPFRTTVDYRYRRQGRGSIRTATFDFTCTRPASTITSTFFSYSSEAGDYIGRGWRDRFGAGEGVWLAEARWAHHGGGVDHVSIRMDDDSQWWNLDFGSSRGDLLVPRRYLNAERWPFHDPPRAGLSVSGNGRGCNTLRGEFTVHELVVGPGGAVERFHAGFKQHCEGDVPALTGEIGIVAEGDVSVHGSAVTAEGVKRATAGAGGAVMRKGAAPLYFHMLP
jgi:hypothetical protein